MLNNVDKKNNGMFITVPSDRVQVIRIEEDNNEFASTFGVIKEHNSSITIKRTVKTKENEFNEIINHFEKNKSQYNINFHESDKLSKFIFNTFSNEDIYFDSTPKIKYIIDKVAETVGYNAIDAALLKILGRDILLSESNTIAKFLAFLSSIDNKKIPLTSIFSMTSLSHHKDSYVKEKVLEMVEQWENPEMVKYLMIMDDFSRPYLQKYKEEVIDYLRGMQ